MSLAVNESVKKPWQSKTLWVSALTVIMPIVAPPAGVWIAANPEAFSALLGVVFAGLRMITHDKVAIK